MNAGRWGIGKFYSRLFTGITPASILLMGGAVPEIQTSKQLDAATLVTAIAILALFVICAFWITGILILAVRDFTRGRFCRRLFSPWAIRLEHRPLRNGARSRQGKVLHHR